MLPFSGLYRERWGGAVQLWKYQMNNNGDEKGLFFLDSGAHSLYNLNVLKKKAEITRVRAEEYTYYETKEFWAYVDAYAAFVKQYEKNIDLYANVDVIYNPAKSWEVQKYLEDEHGLHPVPVVHYGTSLEWVDKYLEGGYKLLGLGGLGQGATKGTYTSWADKLFNHICPASNDHMPRIRTHGFAMTAYDLMIRYPWWSVDSASWTKVGAYGSIMVPHKRQGKFTFEEQPYIITTSQESPDTKIKGKSFQTLAPAEQKIVMEWLQLIDVPFGKGILPSDKEEGTPGAICGVCNHHSQRKVANLLFFEKLREWLPAYPWPFKHGSSRMQGGFFAK